MSRVDDAVQCFCRGAACSQAILGTYGPAVGLEREQAMKLAAGFAGGMRLAQTCGAVTGAFMVLGLKHAGNSVVCKELMGCDISTPEGAQRATKEGLFRTICPQLVQDAAEILEEMI